MLYLAYVLEYSSAEVFQSLLALPWMQDTDTSWQETSVIMDIDAFGRDDPAVALQIVNMPFLENLDAQDLNALSSLNIFAQAEDLGTILEYPWVATGITDDKTPIIARLHDTVDRWKPRPDLIPILFDPEQTVLLTRTIALEHDVALSVVWPAHGATPTKAAEVMDLLEDTIRVYEEFMGMPWPRPTASILVGDVNVWGGSASGLGVTINTSQYNDPALIAHEVAHAYWGYPPGWMSEGGATFLEAIYISQATGTPLPAPKACPYAASLQELTDDTGSPSWGCNYTLGSGLLLELYQALGDETFREAFRTLYKWRRDEALVARCGVTTPLGEQGLCYYHAAFIEGLPEHSPLTDEIIHRHYYGDKPPP